MSENNSYMHGISPSHFLKIVDTLNRGTTLDSLFNSMMEAAPVTMASYHHFPSVGAADYDTLGTFYGYNLPKPIINHYKSYDMRKPDSAIINVFAKGNFVWLSDLLDEPDLLDEVQLKLTEDMVERLGDALLIPLFGPNNRRGYMFVTGDLIKKESGAFLPYQMQALAQLFHSRFCLMIEKIGRQINLTPREAQVLELITYGKSNPEIADVLDISTSTVAGYLKKIFLKLDVSDRVSASMRAQSLRVVF